MKPSEWHNIHWFYKVVIVAAFFCVAYVVTHGWAGDCPDVQVQKEFDVEQFNGKVWCIHSAILAAIVYGEYYPVRFMIGPIKCGGQHVQAQAYIDGEWKWLKLDYQGRPWVSKDHDDFYTPEKAMTIGDYIAKEEQFWGWTSETWKVPTAMAFSRIQKARKLMSSGSGATAYQSWR